MRIAILTHNYPLQHFEKKDAGIFIYDFANALAKKLGKVYIFCPNMVGKKESYKKTPVTWFRWRGEESKLGNLKLWNPFPVLSLVDFFLTGRREVVSFVQKNKIDFCLAMWAWPNGLFALEAKKRLGTPYAVWTLGSDIWTYAKYPGVKSLVKRILCEASLRYGGGYELSRRTQRLGGKKCSYLPTATVIDQGKSKKVDLDKNVFNFMYLGRLVPVKGPDVLLEAAKILKKRTDRFHVYMIGGGKMEGELRKKTRKWGLQDEVTIFGRVDDQRIVNGYLKNCDMTVIPSRFDSLSLVFSESLKMETPMISSDFGDIPHFIKKYNLGFVFENENGRDLAHNMYRALREGRRLQARYRKNMKKLAKIHDINETAKRFIKEAKVAINDRR